jgi:hypothetical protein
MSQNDKSENKPPRSNHFQIGNKFGKGRLLGSKNKNKQFNVTRDKILRDMEWIYNKASKKEHFGVALHAKLYQAKVAGVLRTRKLPPITKLSDMNPDQLKELYEILGANDPEIRDSTIPPEKFHYPLTDK